MTPSPEPRPNSRLPFPDDAMRVPAVLPVLPVRDIVLFPGAEERIRIGRPASIRMIEDAVAHRGPIAVFTQKYDGAARPAPDELCRIGVAAEIGEVAPRENGLVDVAVRPFARIAVVRLISHRPLLRAEVAVARTTAAASRDRQWQATVAELRKAATDLFHRQARPAAETARLQLAHITGPGALADFVAAHLALDISAEQDLLEELDEARRVRAVLLQVADQLEIGRLRRKIRSDVEARFTANRRQAYLHEQLRVIREELGEDRSPGEQLGVELRKRLVAGGLPPAAMARAERELQRLAALHPASGDYLLVADYLDLLATLPWRQVTAENTDLASIRRALDASHYDLENVKQRLIEHVAVRQRNPTGNYPVLCLLGPPGVGKQSLARSLAAALGRTFSMLALGGAQTEAEILGSHRTRPAATPGRPMRELHRLKTRNPLVLLAGVDQLPSAMQGDPAQGLLEVIDPRQNGAFTDRYLDVAFDLSQVFFLATAQYADDIPAVLRERLEIVRLPGYSDEDKRIIARDHLLPCQQAEHGLKPEQCRFEDEALDLIITDYTREAGVRGLDRRLGAVCRAIAVRLTAEQGTFGGKVTPGLIEEIFGPPRFLREARLATANPGVATGLAWTSAGGEIMHIEALRFPGKGQIQLTGQIGGLMKESAQAALSLLKSRAGALDIDLNDLLDSDVHVHVPAGAVPKDGPSAGIAIFAAMVSLWTGQTVRADVAMTGEITLRGLVLPVGGLKEKILAAQRAGIPAVILPRLNEKDLAEVPASVRESMRLVPVETVDEVMKAALNPKPSPPPRGKKSRSRG
ncbi:MAG TPA: endopeptidase La [Lacunisphaera sp.]